MSLSSLLLILCILLCLWLLPQRKEHFEENAMNVQTGNSEKGMFMIDVNNTINASFVVSALPLKNVQIVDSKGVTRTLDIVQMEKLEGGSGNDKYGSWNWHKVFLSKDVIVSPYSLIQIIAPPEIQPVTHLVTQPVTRPGPVNQPVLTSNSQYTVIPPTNLTLS